ncbi:MAG: HEAT repeat domain-containing protein [Longimicrobiales bacterium]|nr:HEAT repeat domain-containing protein [Longimicrobiales bacterium]
MPDSALLVLSLVIAGLVVIALLFSLYALILRLRNARRERLQEQLQQRWEKPILAAIADPERVRDVHPLVPRRYRMHFVQFVLDYARRVRGAERQTLRRLVEPYLDEIVRRADHPRAEVRTRAIQTLGMLGLPKYEKEVLAGLEDPSPLVSMVAARYLARPDFPQYGPALMEHLERFEGWNRSFLASMLAAMGPEVASSLRDGLTDPGTVSWLRAVYAEALRMQMDARAGDRAMEALKSEGGRDRDLTASLLRLLAAVGRPEHVDVVRPLCHSEDEIIRAQALHALGSLGDESELPLLFAGLEDTSPWAALHAARGVREAGGAEMLQEIAQQEGELSRLAGQVLFEEQEG